MSQAVESNYSEHSQYNDPEVLKAQAWETTKEISATLKSEAFEHRAQLLLGEIIVKNIKPWMLEGDCRFNSKDFFLPSQLERKAEKLEREAFATIVHKSKRAEIMQWQIKNNMEFGAEQHPQNEKKCLNNFFGDSWNELLVKYTWNNFSRCWFTD